MSDLEWMLPGMRNAKDLADPLFRLLDSLERRKTYLPAPIPWIEPSINMPYLQACQSYMFQCPLSSILAMGSLIEHCLRIAVIDRYKGQQGAMDRKMRDCFKKFSIGDFLQESSEKKSKQKFDPTLRAHVESIIEPSDLEWWKETSNQLRNKAAHLDIPDLIMNAGRREDLVGNYQDTNDPDLVYGNRFWWGAPFHFSDDLIAAEFLKQATCRLNQLIANMGWKPDTSWWASQQSEYEEFFRYGWNQQQMAESILTMQTYWSRD